MPVETHRYKHTHANMSSGNSQHKHSYSVEGVSFQILEMDETGRTAGICGEHFLGGAQVFCHTEV